MAVFDSGNAETEALLIDTEYEIQEIYDRAAKETQKKLEDYLDGFKRRDAQKQALVDFGKMTEAEYAEWRKNQMLTGQRWKDMVDALTEDHVNADKLAMSAVRGHLPDVYAINANYAAYEVESGTGIDTTFTLYDRQTVEKLVRDKPDLLPPVKPDIPVDRRWNRQHIRNEITQSILQGEDVKQTAKRLQRVTDMDERAALRNARTAMTGAQNAGRIDSYKRAEKMGIKMHQQWVAALDSHTRHAHRDADGQVVKVGEPFEIDGYELEYPGDPTAPGYLIYNCRCRVIADLKDFEFDPSAISVGYDDRLEGITYEDWKEMHRAKVDYGTAVNSVDEAHRRSVELNLDKAPADFRNIWTHSKDDMQAPRFDLDKGGGAYYKPGDNSVHFESEDKAFGRSSYQEENTVFFHEYGHNIDFVNRPAGTADLSTGFEDGAFGKTLYSECQKRLQEFYDQKFSKGRSLWDQTKEIQDGYGGMGMRQYVRSGLRLNMPADEFRKIRPKLADMDEAGLRKLFDQWCTKTAQEDLLFQGKVGSAFCNFVRNNYTIYERSDISDMFEEFMVRKYHIEYPFGVGHGTGYWQKRLLGEDENSYNNHSRLATESFAEMYSASVTGNSSLQTIKEFFPESYSVFERMVRSVL